MAEGVDPSEHGRDPRRHARAHLRRPHVTAPARLWSPTIPGPRAVPDIERLPGTRW